MAKNTMIQNTNQPSMMKRVMNSLIQTISLRSQLNQYNVTHDGKRNLNKIFGYYENPAFMDYYRLYVRNGVANRMVRTIPKACWRDGFTIESESEEIYSNLIKIFNRNSLIQQLEKADILNRIGQYSVMYIGFPDGLDKKLPVGSIPENGIKEIFFAAYDETNIVINKWNSDNLSPRYGLPETYTLTTINLDDTNIQIQRSGIEVHWTRVVHMSENSLNNPLSGTPYLQPVFDRFIDYEKTIGGSAEAYYQNALSKIILETEGGFDDAIPADELETVKKQMREDAEDWTNNFDRVLRLMGTKAKTLPTPHNDPLNTVESIYKEFYSYSGLSKRILTGEGGGEYSGLEDKAALNQLVKDRQDTFCTVAVDQLLRRLEYAGVLELPLDYTVKFPLTDPTSEIDQSKISLNKTKSLELLSKSILDLNLSENDEKIMIEEVWGNKFELEGIDIEDIPEPDISTDL